MNHSPDTARLRAWIDRYGHAGVLLAGLAIVVHHLWQPKRRQTVTAILFAVSLLIWLFAPRTHSEVWATHSVPLTGSPQTAYTLTDINAPDNSEAVIPIAINNKGQVAGYVQFRGFVVHAFLWDSGKFTDLGTLPGGQLSFASGINDRGQIVGYSTLRNGTPHAVVWENGKITDLGTLPGVARAASIASGINNQGQLVGLSTTGDDLVHTVVWQNGQVKDISPDAEYSFSRGINDKGEVAGYELNFDTFTLDPVVYRDGKWHELPRLNGEFGAATAINNNGLVVGFSEYKGKSEFNYHGAAWRDGKAIELGDLGGRVSEAMGVNDRGDVVGGSFTSILDYHAVVWQQGKIRDLNDSALSGWGLKNALGINNRGQIVGVGATDGAVHGFLLTPKN